MDKSDQNNQILKIIFLEINPPMNEIVKNKEEINIIFQGHDNFYDFKKHLLAKTPIYLNRYKNSLMMTLLKSNSILATGLFTIRQGEQNVIFNYESKKKYPSTKAININNLSDFIKIKILCELDSNIKDKDHSLSSSNNILNENKINDSANKYVPKVNLMKQNHNIKNRINVNNNINIGATNGRKKKFLGNSYMNSSKKNFNNSSQEFSLVGEYSAYLTEEFNNIRQTNNNEIKKLNPHNLSKINSINSIRKNEIENTSKNKGQINKAKSKNYFNSIKKQYNIGIRSQIKMNNSSMNLIDHQANKFISLDKTDNNINNINNNRYNNKIKLKPTASFNKNNKRNFNNNKINNLNNHKNLITSLDHVVSGQIIEHVDMSKKEFQYIKTNININENKNLTSNNKNINNKNNFGLNKNESQKRKLNNNNVTINSVSTAGTKKNDLEYSNNSLPDYEDKNNNNKNNFKSFTNRLNNERLQQKLSANNINNRNIIIHKFNKSEYQQSFTEKIFNENDSNINVNIPSNIPSMCKSYNKLPNEFDLKLNLNKEKEGNATIGIENDKKIENNNSKFEEEEDEEIDNYKRIKEDFNLLYNKDYIHKINEDLLKFEIELLIEKMTELFSTYHLIMDSKILENQILKRDYNKNIAKYLMYLKLINKMKFIKAQLEIKKCNLKDQGINMEKQNFDNVNINYNELDILKIIFPDKKNSELNKSNKLKKLLLVILKKHGNALDEKYKGLLK